MFFLSPEGDRYYLGKPFTYNEVMYGVSSATQAQYTELGFTRVVPQPRPDIRFYVVTGPDDAGQYQSTPRDVEQLKKTYIADEIELCQARLKDTDWMLVRAGEVERNVAVPQAVTSYRAEARTVCQANVQAIQACQTVEELQPIVDNLQQPAEFEIDDYLTPEYL